MAKENEKMNDEELEKKGNTEPEEETKGNEPEDQAEDNQDKGAENPPAKADDEKKGFHPIQALKNKAAEFSENHPKVVSGVKTAGKVAGGVVIGAVGTVAVLASIAAKKGIEENKDEDSCDDEDEDVIDSEATELDDSES